MINEDYKKILIQTFTHLVDFLELHNIEWYVDFGTLIGTMRHSGLIPWDDDIDILMPRHEFLRFIELYEQENTDYYVLSPLTPNYPFAFGKFCYKHSTIVETKMIPCAFGIYVDIFPYDEADGEFGYITHQKLKYEYLHKRYEYSCNRYATQYVFSLFKGVRLLNLWRCLKDSVLRFFSKHLISEMKQIENEFRSYGGNKYYVVLCGLYGERDIYKSEWFSDFIYSDFENIKVRVPVGYDQCLKMIYGDYMQLPPKEQRVSKHFHVYENLEIGMNIKEVRKYYNPNIE